MYSKNLLHGTNSRHIYPAHPANYDAFWIATSSGQGPPGLGITWRHTVTWSGYQQCTPKTLRLTVNPHVENPFQAVHEVSREWNPKIRGVWEWIFF